jgi:hypothetical protein
MGVPGYGHVFVHLQAGRSLDDSFHRYSLVNRPAVRAGLT